MVQTYLKTNLQFEKNVIKVCKPFFYYCHFRALIQVQDDPTHTLQYISHTHNISHTLGRELNLNIYTKIKR
jgi:hypothetical protein